MLQYFKSSNHFSFPVIVTNEVSEMEFDEDAPNNSRVHPRNLYSQPSANPEDINRIWKVNDKFYYHIVKLNSLGSLDYKELQGVATYLGLPGNLKVITYYSNYLLPYKTQVIVLQPLIYLQY